MSADVIDITSREKVILPTPSHRDSEYILADDDWDQLCNLMTWADRESIELFIMEAIERE